MGPPGHKVSNILLEKNREITLETIKRQGQSGKDAELWMCLGVRVESDAISIGTWNVR